MKSTKPRGMSGANASRDGWPFICKTPTHWDLCLSSFASRYLLIAFGAKLNRTADRGQSGWIRSLSVLASVCTQRQRTNQFEPRAIRFRSRNRQYAIPGRFLVPDTAVASKWAVCRVHTIPIRWGADHHKKFSIWRRNLPAESVRNVEGEAELCLGWIYARRRKSSAYPRQIVGRRCLLRSEIQRQQCLSRIGGSEQGHTISSRGIPCAILTC